MTRSTYRKPYTKRAPYAGNDRSKEHDATIEKDTPNTVLELHQFLQETASSSEEHSQPQTQLEANRHSGLMASGYSDPTPNLQFWHTDPQLWDMTSVTPFDDMFSGCTQLSNTYDAMAASNGTNRMFNINVVDLETNEPLPDTQIYIRPADGNYETPAILNEAADSNGRLWVMAPAPDGTFFLRARCCTDDVFYKTFECEFELIGGMAFETTIHLMADDYRTPYIC